MCVEEFVADGGPGTRVPEKHTVHESRETATLVSRHSHASAAYAAVRDTGKRCTLFAANARARHTNVAFTYSCTVLTAVRPKFGLVMRLARERSRSTRARGARPFVARGLCADCGTQTVGPGRVVRMVVAPAGRLGSGLVASLHFESALMEQCELTHRGEDVRRGCATCRLCGAAQQLVSEER